MLDELIPEAFARSMGGIAPHHRPAPLRGAASRRHHPPRRQDRRDEDGRGQDAGGRRSPLPQRPHRARRAPVSPSTNTWSSATPTGWARSTRCWACPWALSCRAWTPAERKAEYAADITYGTNSEFGFDYLRDNIANDPDDMVQRPHNYCIVDEVDNILIDEARTPLIISGASEGSAEVHIRAAAIRQDVAPRK